jgi:hypothetical protein
MVRPEVTDHQISCPDPRCPGVLRYPLQLRLGGFLAQCEPKEPLASPLAVCGRIYRWNAASEEWASILHDPRSP